MPKITVNELRRIIQEETIGTVNQRIQEMPRWDYDPAIGYTVVQDSVDNKQNPVKYKKILEKDLYEKLIL